MSAAKVVRQVSVEEAKALLDDGVQLVDVLPHETYLQSTCPGLVPAATAPAAARTTPVSGTSSGL